MADLTPLIYDSIASVTQNNRLLQLTTTLGDDLLLPQRVIAHDRLGRSYEYTVDCLARSDTLELKKRIAQPVTLWVQQADQTYLPVHGYVYRAQRLGSDGQFAHCQLSFAPWLHFLKYRRDVRIWQDKAADDILTEVFNGHPQAEGHFRFDVRTPALPRSYCTQYETDWHFVHRLMEEEGWYGYHEQKPDGSGHLLVIADTADQLASVPGERVLFHRAGTEDELHKIVHWGAGRTIAASKFSASTDDYKAPNVAKATNTLVTATHGDLPAQLEVNEYTGAYTYATQEQGDRQSPQGRGMGIEHEALCGGVRLRSLPAGSWFTLEDHPLHDSDSADDRQFMVIAVEWCIENNLPISNQVKDFPGSLLPQVLAFKAAVRREASAGQLATDGANEHTGHCFNRSSCQFAHACAAAARLSAPDNLIPLVSQRCQPGHDR
ncbi:type VI secretion system secreted protein VgrG [Pseudoduganella lurida]|uniref:Type VI secretion system secreted protein VgrG n=1 Tax=Pseudoduganella lurida TaxID=1036180 RepID=A0A562RER8_9BURK|nr:phage late control D family protein [Pseudoduganella lurida]TWI67551.1 type VI secretion system secreted protein VgrG [Pseudoduganella lurida]